MGKENNLEECRIGLEPVDHFECTNATPQGFYSTAFIKVFSVKEVLRGEGDLRYLGSSTQHKMVSSAPMGSEIHDKWR